MADFEYQTPDEARRRIEARNKDAALAWLEQVGSYPSSDAEVREVTRMANRLLGFPSSNPRKLTKPQWEEYFKHNVLPGVEDRYERDGIPDRPARREAWNDSVDAAIKADALPESAGDWKHPKWLETLRVTPLPNPTPVVTLGQALVALGLTGIAVTTVVAGVRMGRAA
jgi:hypothetical protein